MTYKDILNRVQICKSFITEELRFVIVKKKDGDLVEVSESRDLTNQEILAYTTQFIDYLISKGTTEISNPKTGEVWKFSKVDNNGSNQT